MSIWGIFASCLRRVACLHEFDTLLLLFVVIVVLVAGAKRFNLPYPIALLLGGLVLGFIPGIPTIRLTPDLVFLLFLPPLLQAEAWFTSWRDFTGNLRPIGLLAVGLVLATTFSLAYVVHALIPGFPLSAAIVLGAIAAPTDAVAVSAVAETLRVPRRILVILSGESLLNDATALAVYRASVAAVVTGTFSLWGAIGNFALGSVGGIVIGMLTGYILGRILERVNDTTLGIVISLLAPYIAYLGAEKLHFSGVLATVVAGLYLGRKANRILSPDQRTQGMAFWQVLILLLNGFLFFLLGMELNNTLKNMSGRSALVLFGYAVAASLAVILTRIIWIAVATYLPRYLNFSLRKQDPYPMWQNVAVVAWAGARGGVSLASALTVPLVIQSGAPFPQRDMILFLTFGIIFATLVLQGLSLPTLINHLHLQADHALQDEEKHARIVATKDAIAHLETQVDESGVSSDTIEDIRRYYTRRLEHINTPPDDGTGEALDTHRQRYLTLKQSLIAKERATISRLRNEGVISDEAMNRVLRDLDLDEIRIAPRQEN